MIEILGALALLAAQDNEIVVEKELDPVVCKGNRSTKRLGSNMSSGKICKRESQWKEEEAHARRELRSISDRWKDPAPANGR